MVLILCLFFYEPCHVAFPCSLFSCLVLFGTVITSPWEEKAGLYASRAFVCASCMHYFLFSLPHGDRGWLRLVIVTLHGLFVNLLGSY